MSSDSITTKPQSGSLSFIMHHVADVPAARAFYTETLGFTILTEGPTFIQFAPQGGEGASYAIGLATETPPKEAELWWYVADVDALHAQLGGQGVTVTQPLHDEPFGRTFTIQDLDGHPLNFLQLAR